MGHAYLSLSTVKRFEPDAAKRGVSAIARSPSGFLTAYKRAGGSSSKLSDKWRAKREAFIARHMAQVKQGGEKLFDGRGRPTRRHLALIMWAYSPQAGRLGRKNPGEFAPHKANPYLPDTEQPDLLAPIDTPRFVSVEELVTPKVRELLSIVELGRSGVAGMTRHQQTMRTTPAPTSSRTRSWDESRAAERRYQDARRELFRQPVIRIGQDAYTVDEFAELSRISPTLSQMVLEYDLRHEKLAEALQNDVSHLDDEHHWWNYASDDFSNYDGARDDARHYLQEHGDRWINEAVDEEAVEERLTDFLNDSDYWSELEQGEQGWFTWDWSDSDWPIELNESFDVVHTYGMSEEEVDAVIEELHEDERLDEGADTALYYGVHGHDVFNLGSRQSWARYGRSHAPTIYVGIPFVFGANPDWDRINEEMDEWSAEALAEWREEHGVEPGAPAPAQAQDEAAAQARAAEAERLADERRRAQAERAEEEAERAAADAAKQSLLNYVRTGLPWDERIVYTFEDGTYVVKLDTFVELRMESGYLKHCVGKSVTLEERGAHWWPELFHDEKVDIYSMRPPGYEVMGKRVKRRAPFLTIAVWQEPSDRAPELELAPQQRQGSHGSVADVRGFDNRPAGFTKREGQGERGFNPDEAYKLLEWWLINKPSGSHGFVKALSSGGTNAMIIEIAKRAGWAPGRRSVPSESAASYVWAHRDEVLGGGYDPAEGMRGLAFEEGDWPYENPADEDEPHVCSGEGFCADPWCGVEP